MQMKKLSIIIVTYNSEKDIYDCVRSLMHYSDIPLSEIELIIVDNSIGPSDAMFSQLRNLWGDDILCIRNDHNGGYGQGNNVGLRQSHSPIAMIMNPDVRLRERVFSRALQRFDEESQLAVLGMKQYSSQSAATSKSFACGWLINGYFRTLLSVLCTRLDWFFPSCMYVQGSCFFLRKEPFESVGMFDETNFLYGEEEDIHYRLVEKFGTACYRYDKKLSYIHLTAQRDASLKYEKDMVDANVSLYTKKGIPSSIIVRHYKQSIRLLLFLDTLKGRRNLHYRQVLEQFLEYLDQK